MVSVRNPVWRPWRSLRAYPLDALGRNGEAVALLEEELALVRAWGAKSTVGRTLRMVAETRQDPGLARAELTEAIELLSGTGARLQLARAHNAMGRVEPDPQRPSSISSRRWSWPGSAALVACAPRSRPSWRRAARTVPNQPEVTTLTTSERKMAAMASEGHDLRAIAQALFVTPRTVEVTLAELRERLGLATDVELAAALDSH